MWYRIYLIIFLALSILLIILINNCISNINYNPYTSHLTTIKLSIGEIF